MQVSCLLKSTVGVPKKSSAAAEMGDRLATIDMALKVGGCCATVTGESWVPI